MRSLARAEHTVPVRTCVGCREKGQQQHLLRVVLADNGELTPDPRRRLPGRGAWLHPQPKCWELARSRRAFERAFALSKQSTVDAHALVDFLRQSETARSTVESRSDT